MKTKNNLFKKVLPLLLTFNIQLFALFVFSQGTAINTSGAAADPSAMLDVNSSDKGILIPRLTTAQKNAIPNPVNGLIVYQTDSVTGLYYYDVNKWKLVGSNAGDNLGNHTANQVLDMNNKRITNLASASAPNDAVNAENVQSGELIYAASAGSNNNYTVTLNPGISSYKTGFTVNFTASFENTGPVTLNVNGLGAKNIKKNYNLPLVASDIKNNQLVSVIYDGNDFQMLSQLASSGGITMENFNQTTCIGPKTNVTWGDLYPSAVSAGYSLNKCVPRKISGQSSEFGWAYLGMASSGCGGGSYVGTYSPNPTDTWNTSIYSNGSSMYWFIIYNRTVDILCFK
jgi:hypothetical protein